MRLRVLGFLATVPFLSVGIRTSAQEASPDVIMGGGTVPGTGGLNRIIETGNIDVFVSDPNNEPFAGTAVVTLIRLSGQVYRQGALDQEGSVRFNNVALSEYNVQVVAPAFERAVKHVDLSGKPLMRVTIVLRPEEGIDASSALSLAMLKPKAQKEIAKAMAALREEKPEAARSHLDAANRVAPNHAEVIYLYGVYSSQLKQLNEARTYWTQALTLNPRHARALLSLGELSMQNKKYDEALDYGNRAVQADSGSWRAHALLAEVHLWQGSREESIKEAERALELGHGQAATIQPWLARALAERGERERAIGVLDGYVHDHPGDLAAKADLDRLRQPPVSMSVSGPAGANEAEMKATSLNEAVLGGIGDSTWRPPEIDESIPPIEPGATCALDEVVQKAGEQMEELVRNVDRFTATEAVTHEAINKKGVPSIPETAKFDYMVSIQAFKSGFLNVEEYRQRKNASAGFPDSVMVNGLPAMVLVFHPRFAPNYAITCEGLSRLNGQLAWQVHFQQRKDRPNQLRSYKLGPDGPAYPVAVKGRAWIGADAYEILRMETDLVSPLPEIRLTADHIAVEYGPVVFRKGRTKMWLPRTAEVFYDWKGRRVHRQHRFSNYLLFSVDDKQKISAPKGEESAALPGAAKSN